MLDRTQAPTFQTIQHVSIPAVQARTLDNGLPLYVVQAGEQPVVRIELVFEAGAWYEPTPGVANFAVRMLNEGTSEYTSAELADFFDQFGAFLEFAAGLDRATVTLYALAKHLPMLLPRLRTMLEDSVFPQTELDTLKTISLQALKVNLEKTAYVANQQFRERIFGVMHPYGQRQTEERIQGVTREQVRAFYEQAIRQRPCRIFLAGRVSEADLAVVNDVFGQATVVASSTSTSQPAAGTPSTQSILVEKPDSLQSTIRMGRVLFTRSHPDFFPFLVLNEVFGGYFGSRLMRNIREDKGFTYGISSQLPQQSRAGYLLIGTDVKKTDTQQTLDEIRREMERLQTELVPADELETVRNFMTGEFVGSLNTPFEIADRHKVRILENLPDDFHATYVEKLRAVTAEQVRDIARQYLVWEALQEVVVGGK
jgi:predicted Zn-dependent peptidase